MSTIVSLAKPGTRTSGLMLPAIGGGKTDVVGVAQGVIKMQAQRVRIESSEGMREVTGDGDQASAWEANLLPNTRITISGHVLSASAFGFTELDSTSNNGTWAIKINLSSTRTFSAYALIEALIVDWAANDEAVSCLCVLRVTNTSPGDMEGTLGAAV